jgi:hypothetical protein
MALLIVAWMAWKASRTKTVRWLFCDYTARAAAWCCLDTGWQPYKRDDRWMVSLKSDYGLLFVYMVKPDVIWLLHYSMAFCNEVPQEVLEYIHRQDGHECKWEITDGDEQYKYGFQLSYDFAVDNPPGEELQRIAKKMLAMDREFQNKFKGRYSFFVGG